MRKTVLAMTMAALAAQQPGDARIHERQVTYSAKNHDLDNNDNFSADGRFLCYDTREPVGLQIDHSQSIEKVEVATGIETVLYAPPSVAGEHPAPGVGAVSYCPVHDHVAFIHGPSLEELDRRGPYAKTNRNGAEVAADGGGVFAWLDYRDTATDRNTLPGAHRGGTHRHEYSRDGRRIGFTYDDALLTEYGRTVGYMERHPKAPGNATHFFAILVRVVPQGAACPGEIETAFGDSWVDSEGTMRAFIGKVRAADGIGYEESLFVVDVPKDVDITTADSGSVTRYPSPPEGVRIRRLTYDWAGGIVRGTPDGSSIAYYGRAQDGTTQVFIIPSSGSDRSDDPAKRPRQVTFLTDGAGPGLRWHPSGRFICCTCEGGIAVTCVKDGPAFGHSWFLTPRGDGAERTNLVWSPDGSVIAFNKNVTTYDAQGRPVCASTGHDFRQIFVVPFYGGPGAGFQ